MADEIETLRAEYDVANDTYDAFCHRHREIGLWATWLECGRSLREARDTFRRVGLDPRIKPTSRAVALMNAANALSEVGRHFEALDIYEQADRIRPNDGMIRGNRGIELYKMAMGMPQGHQPLVARAISDLTFAVGADHLDGNSGQKFGAYLTRLAHHRDDANTAPAPGEYSDPYAAWSRDQNLLLSPSLGTSPAEQDLDSALASGLVAPIAELMAGESPIPSAFSAINAVKRDYLTARFLAYLAIERPTDAHLGSRSRSARFAETLDYARWDLSAGLAASAYASAINLADKIATFLAYWLGLPHGRVNDRNWAFTRVRQPKGTPTSGELQCGPVHPLVDKLMEPRAEKVSALLGLLDLAQEEAESQARQVRRDVRDAAIHGFLSVRMERIGMSSGFIYPVGESDLHRDLIDALRQVRRMFLQTVLAVSQKGRLDSSDKTPPMILLDYENPVTAREP